MIHTETKTITYESAEVRMNQMITSILHLCRNEMNIVIKEQCLFFFFLLFFQAALTNIFCHLGAAELICEYTLTYYHHQVKISLELCQCTPHESYIKYLLSLFVLLSSVHQLVAHFGGLLLHSEHTLSG